MQYKYLDCLVLKLKIVIEVIICNSYSLFLETVVMQVRKCKRYQNIPESEFHFPYSFHYIHVFSDCPIGSKKRVLRHLKVEPYRLTFLNSGFFQYLSIDFFPNESINFFTTNIIGYAIPLCEPKLRNL